jgi:hypothetical protein
MVEEAAEQARTEVAAAICVDRFMGAGDARAQLASLKEIGRSWDREDFVEEGGWAKVADQEYDDAAELCAEKLMEMELPPAREAATTESGTVAQ